ncbi:MAG: insulinase family protein, partial [Acidaminococcaceae bacterium]
KLLYVGNKDDNKVFSISFRTPPNDDTGVAHILEHSVLCGSRKYRLKEPFVELVKGSMNTFLNAMTYPDKTMYPVASRNNKDFQNLMDVYLDAVFYPLIYENEYTLLQEGWHYSIKDKNEPLRYNGVVYNEMKGVFSSADALLDYESMRALFPDTAYRFESGGHPDSIPELTQEQFLTFHKTYYSPENAYIYLYGDLDILKTLDFLDCEYLNHFTKSGEVNSAIAIQKSFAKTKDIEATYPIGENEDIKGKTYHELHVVVGTATDIKTGTALRLLESVLLETNSAPLKLALIEAEIGSDISGSYAGSYLQPIFSIKVAGSEPELRDKFISVTYKTLQDITLKGIDKELLEAALNSLEFKLREADFGVYPKGLIYGISCMDSWLYDGNPFECLRFEGLLHELRNGIKTRYYEQLIENYILDNTHKVLITLCPEQGKEEREHRKDIDALTKIKSELKAEKVQELIEQTKILQAKQIAPDEAVAMEAIPVLERTDLRQQVDPIPAERNQKGDSTQLYLGGQTNKIAYLNWYFDLSGISKELLPYAYLLSDILGKVDTKDYTYQSLATATNKYTGGVGFQLSAYSKQNMTDEYSICFAVQAKVLIDKIDKLFDILRNVALTSKFDNRKRIWEIINEINTDWDSQFFNRGQSIACTRLCSYFSLASRVNEQDYLSYYYFIKKLVANFDQEFPQMQEKFRKLLGVFFHSSKSLFAYSCEEDVRNKVLLPADEFMSLLPKSDYAGKKPETIPLKQINEGIATSGKVQYVAAGGSYRKFGYDYTGAMKVLETILRYDYLWNRVRVQGGAYGANARFDRNGIVYFSSYRDPNLEKTLQVYRNLPKYLAEFSATERELTKYVIGTVSGMDTPLTNSMLLERACVMSLKEISDDMRQKERQEVIEVTNEDIKQLAKLVEDVLKENYRCAVGSKATLDRSKDIFTEIIYI